MEYIITYDIESGGMWGDGLDKRAQTEHSKEAMQAFVKDLQDGKTEETQVSNIKIYQQIS